MKPVETACHARERELAAVRPNFMGADNLIVE